MRPHQFLFVRYLAPPRGSLAAHLEAGLRVKSTFPLRRATYIDRLEIELLIRGLCVNRVTIHSNMLPPNGEIAQVGL